MGEAKVSFAALDGIAAAAGPGPDRRRHCRADDRQGHCARARQAADRRQSSRSACADGAAHRRRRRFPIACFSPPAAIPKSSPCAASAIMCGSAARSMTRSARPSTRPRSCSGLGYPGGPLVEKEAARGDPRALRAAAADERPPRCGFFAVGPEDRAAHRGGENRAALRSGRRRSLRVVSAGGGRCRQRPAARRLAHVPLRFDAPKALVCAGGVAANQAIRKILHRVAFEVGTELVAPPPALCTDNGAMIAWAGAERLALGLTDSLSVAPRARWPLDEVTKGRGEKVAARLAAATFRSARASPRAVPAGRLRPAACPSAAG